MRTLKMSEQQQIKTVLPYFVELLLQRNYEIICKGVTKRDTLTNGGNQSLSFILEPELYRLIAKSNLLYDRKFENKLFEIVLPSIRETEDI